MLWTRLIRDILGKAQASMLALRRISLPRAVNDSFRRAFLVVE
jgi:hypothetical protein